MVNLTYINFNDFLQSFRKAPNSGFFSYEIMTKTIDRDLEFCYYNELN
jgi:hypothetical protein